MFTACAVATVALLYSSYSTYHTYHELQRHQQPAHEVTQHQSYIIRPGQNSDEIAAKYAPVRCHLSAQDYVIRFQDFLTHNQESFVETPEDIFSRIHEHKIELSVKSQERFKQNEDAFLKELRKFAEEILIKHPSDIREIKLYNLDLIEGLSRPDIDPDIYFHLSPPDSNASGYPGHIAATIKAVNNELVFDLYIPFDVTATEHLSTFSNFDLTGPIEAHIEPSAFYEKFTHYFDFRGGANFRYLGKEDIPALKTYACNK